MIALIGALFGSSDRAGRDAGDEELIRALAAGDREAFARLVERHQRRLYNVCLRLVREREDAMDLTQDAFVRIAERIGSFAGASSFATWSHRLTVNLCLDHLRRRKARRESPAGDGMPDLADPRERPDEVAVGRADARPLWAALADLDEPLRLTVVLADVEGMSLAEVAHVLGVAEGTVKSRLHRARARLLAAVEGAVEPPSVVKRPTRRRGDGLE